MRIRYRILFSICLALVVAVAGMYGIANQIMMTGILNLERQDATKDTSRINRTLETLVSQVHNRSVDWAAWDDMYQYMSDRNVAFHKSNINDPTLTSMKVDMLLLLDKRMDEFECKTISRIPNFPAMDDRDIRSQLVYRGKLDKISPNSDGFCGVLTSHGKAVIVSVRPIHKSDGSGDYRGWLIFARYISPETLGQLNTMVRAESTVQVLSPEIIRQPETHAILQQLKWNPTYIEPINEGRVAGYSQLTDIFGKPAVLIESKFDRLIYQQGLAIIDSLLLQLLFLGTSFALIILFVIERSAVSRILSLSNQVKAVEHSSAGEVVKMKGRDEISQLASRINVMLQNIYKGQQAIQQGREELRQQNANLEKIVSERTKEIEHQAFHDALTGLPNRSLFLNTLETSIRECNESNQVALLFIDLDNFKVINDSLGHEYGDQLLCAFTARLEALVGQEGTVTRLGGDEFTVILPRILNQESAEFFARRILDSLDDELVVGDNVFHVTASIGLTMTADPTKTCSWLLREADMAMYEAKKAGKSSYAIFTPELEYMISERLVLENSLRSALENREISVVYQPLIRLSDHALYGAEALVRWNHPTFGEISPGRFIPIAEESGMILPIGLWVLRESCRQGMHWKQSLELPDFVMSVNISGRQLHQADIVQSVKDILEETKFPASNLKLEITESILMEGNDGVIERMRALKELGIKLALDDFGTGYSSLSTLRLFPIDTLKIDRAFVSSLDGETGSMAIVKAILALAKSLKLDVIGEGIETEAQQKIIGKLGCDNGQGYFFDKPLKAADFENKYHINSDKSAA